MLITEHPFILTSSKPADSKQINLVFHCIVNSKVFAAVIRALREDDITKFHIQLCISLMAMLMVFLIGIDRTENEVACTVMSCVILYFALSSVFWMGAEAMVIYKIFVTVFGAPSTRLVIIASMICWGEY